MDQFLRIVSLCVALASAETLHGIFRAAVLVPRIGKKAALKVSIVTGSALAFGVCSLFVPSIGIAGTAGLLLLGFSLACFMAVFDILLARLVMKLPWRRVLQDFNPATGNYLTFGLLALSTFPYVVVRL